MEQFLHFRLPVTFSKYSTAIHLVFIGMALLFSSYGRAQTFEITSSDSLSIDSLIHSEWIMPDVLMIGLGADAVTAISTGKGIVVIDAGYSTGLAVRYRHIIDNQFKNEAIIYLINTHPHPDHIGGNPVFTEALMIGHQGFIQACREEGINPEDKKERLARIVEEYDRKMQMEPFGTRGFDDAFCQKMRYLNAYLDFKEERENHRFDSTFIDSLHLSAGRYHFDIYHMGAIHSASDIMIYIPELQLLFSGDLFSKYGRPSIRGEGIENRSYTLTMLQKLLKRDLQIEKVIGGHGEIMDISDLESFYHKLETMQ